MNVERILLWGVVIFVGYMVYKHFTRAKKPAKAGSSTGVLTYGSPSLR